MTARPAILTATALLGATAALNGAAEITATPQSTVEQGTGQPAESTRVPQTIVVTGQRLRIDLGIEQPVAPEIDALLEIALEYDSRLTS